MKIYIKSIKIYRNRFENKLKSYIINKKLKKAVK